MKLDAQIGVNVTADTRDRARAAVAALRGTDAAVDGGLSGLVEQALLREVKRLERAHNGGVPFDQVTGLTRGPGV